jgi:hypothetical protein
VNITSLGGRISFPLNSDSEVAKVILQAVTSDNPDFRYTVGEDAAMTLESRRNMSDSEFQNMSN